MIPFMLDWLKPAFVDEPVPVTQHPQYPFQQRDVLSSATEVPLVMTSGKLVRLPVRFID